MRRESVGWASLAVLAGAMGYGVLQQGGTRWAEWSYCLIALGVATGCYWLAIPPRRYPVGPAALGLFCAMGLLIVLQLLPLPRALLWLIAPRRAAALDGAAHVLGPWSWAPASSMASVTFQKALGVLGCILVVLWVADFSRRFRFHPWAVVWPLVVIGVAEAVLGLVQASWAGAHGIATGTYPNRNHYCGFLELCLPFATMRGLAIVAAGSATGGLTVRAALAASGMFAAAALILLAIVSSLSRMGFAAALFALFMLAVASPRGRTGPTWGWFARCALGLLPLLAAVFLAPDNLIRRFGQLAGEDISDDVRTRIWLDTFRLIADQPVLGCGLGAFAVEFTRHQTRDFGDAVTHAHNDDLQVAAELGLPGLGLRLALGFVTMRAAWDTARRTLVPDERCRALGCLGALTAFAVHSLVDFNLYIPANATALAWVAGIASSRVDAY